MKKILILLCFSLPFTASASETKYYLVEKGDTLGSVVLSMGYLKLWSGSAYVNKFKNKVSPRKVHNVSVGDKIYFDESDIIFKKNIRIEGDRIFIVKKIIRIAEWKAQKAAEDISGAPAVPVKVVLESEKTTHVYENKSWSFDLYTGLGLFSARDVENDRSTQTTTMTGLQPIVQMKGIYSHLKVGSIAFDVLAKKIFNSKFNFPVNTDFRFQYLPKWIDLNFMNLAFSWSTLRHSYVGNPEDEAKEYELSADFVGMGLVWPRESYWYEIYIEKAISGEARSNEQTITLKDGWRIDSELIYPVSKKLRIIPGINYYTTKNSSLNYQMSVLEFRSTLVWELNL